jgi:hypothetical protein
VAKDRDKYQVRSLYLFILNKPVPKEKEYKELRQIENYWFKPYEIRRITPSQALAHLHSPLTQAYLYRIYEDPNAIKVMKNYIQQL